MFPFTAKQRKKQRAWASVFSLGGLLLVAIGLAVDLPPLFLKINLVTFIGIISFILGIVYLIDILE